MRRNADTGQPSSLDDKAVMYCAQGVRKKFSEQEQSNKGVCWSSFYIEIMGDMMRYAIWWLRLAHDTCLRQ